MAQIVGSTVEVVLEGTDFDDTPLTPDKVVSTELVITDVNADIVALGAFTWDPVEELWKYRWNTEGAAPGTYTPAGMARGVEGTKALSFGKIRLKAPKVIPTLDGGTVEPPSWLFDGGTPLSAGGGLLDGGGV